MLAKKITSLQHPLVKHWKKLRQNKAYRDESQTVLISGEKIIREFFSPIKSLLTLEASDLAAQESFLVSEEILKKITGLEQPDGFAAEVDLPEPQDLKAKHFILILDQIQDPGNLGTLLRTSLAFGWEGVIATPGTVDFFNEKTLRASQGAIFRLPYCWQTHEELSSWIEEKKIKVWLADTQGESIEAFLDHPPLALILSKEGRGPSPWSRQIGQRISIPMKNEVESLNVASAGAILLYTMRKIS